MGCLEGTFERETRGEGAPERDLREGSGGTMERVFIVLDECSMFGYFWFFRTMTERAFSESSVEAVYQQRVPASVF